MKLIYPVLSSIILGYLSILIFILTQNDKNCSTTKFTLKTSTITILIFNILYTTYLIIANIYKNYNKYVHMSKIIIDIILSHFLYYNLLEYVCKIEVNLLWCWCLITLLFNIITILIFVIILLILCKEKEEKRNTILKF